MRRLFAAVVFALALMATFSPASYAADVLWKRIRLDDAGIVSIPASWTVLQINQPKTENAYGKGVSARICLSAQDSESSLMLLEYRPFSVSKQDEDYTAKKFTEDIASEMMRQYNAVDTLPTQLRIKTGDKLAFVTTYRINAETSQTLGSFFHGGKIYCLIITYRPSKEYNATRLLRQVIHRWKF